jgi:hypothetical protein
MADYYIGAGRVQKLQPILTMKGDVRSISIDFSIWAADNSAVTSVTWTTESGQAAVSSSSVTSSIETATITTSQAGNSLLKAVATNGTKSIAVYLPVTAQDPDLIPATDYWPAYAN